jgi:hypothetical protein
MVIWLKNETHFFHKFLKITMGTKFEPSNPAFFLFAEQKEAKDKEEKMGKKEHKPPEICALNQNPEP